MKNNIVNDKKTVHIVGAGLAGSECAYQLARMGHSVVLYEMRTPDKPETYTPAHKTAQFAELVCSNSFGSMTDYSAPGQLKWEAEQLGSLILQAAKKAQVPAGMALAVDRALFSSFIEERLQEYSNLKIVRAPITSLADIPRPAVIATGPLTDIRLAKSIQEHFDNNFLYFFDAIAPIIDADSIDMDIAFVADRFGAGSGDYLNCPMNKEEYFNFIEEVKKAQFIAAKDFEAPTEETPFFEGCMPIEEIIRRGDQTLRFGPLSPKGITNPKNGEKYFAIVQLRKENVEGTCYNMVGFQTKMSYGDQKRIFSMIPGLKNAEFLKLGSIHRNMYIQTPKVLNKNLSSSKDPELFFAGQITGVEGYFESTCIGLLVAHFLSNQLEGKDFTPPPRASAFGSLWNALTTDNDYFQPTNINFGLMPPLQDTSLKGRKNKDKKREEQLQIAKDALLEWINSRSTN